MYTVIYNVSVVIVDDIGFNGLRKLKSTKKKINK